MVEEKPAVDFKASFESIIKEMTSRIDKKIKIAETKDLSATDIVPGPLMYKCDKPPLPLLPSGPVTSTATCPPGVYIQNNQLYLNGTVVALPSGIIRVFYLR